jgi:hypothetical protein
MLHSVCFMLGADEAMGVEELLIELNNSKAFNSSSLETRKNRDMTWDRVNKRWNSRVRWHRLHCKGEVNWHND